MDERTIKVQALREDFPFYAGQCLWIQTKEGRLQPLVLMFSATALLARSR